MKVILTKPFLHKRQRMIATIPIGLLYLASYLKKYLADVEVSILDPDVFNGAYEDFINKIKAAEPDIIGITVFSHVVIKTIQMVDTLRDIMPSVPIILGGSHVNAVREYALQQMMKSDYAIYGEGEKGFIEFCRQFSLKGNIVDPNSIPGLIYRAKSSILSVANSYTEDLDEFDPIDYSQIDLPTYFKYGSPMGLFRFGEKVVQIITTRGCPFSCTFCASPVNMGKRVRKRSTSNIIEEIENLISLGADEIHVMDDNFTFDRDHVINLCKGIVNRRLSIRFSMPNGVRLDRLDEEMLIWMKRAGWYHLGFGIEVGSDDALTAIRKGISMIQIEEKVDLVKKVGFTTAGFFILGFPHDSLRSIQETAAMPDKLGLDMAAFGNFTPLPGTQLYNELVKIGEIEEGYLPSFSSGEITYTPSKINPIQLARLQRNIVFKYWTHPRRIKIVLSRLRFRDLVYVFRRLFLICFRPALS